MPSLPGREAKLAALYAALHTGTPGDVAYYQRACSDAHSILELGCGYGRMLEALGDSNATRVGIDRDIDLLRIAATRLARTHHQGAQLVCADMRRFAFDQRFDRILLPYTGLYCLADDEEVVECFSCLREHLAPSGHFIFDAYCADPLHHAADEPEVLHHDSSATVVTTTGKPAEDACDDDVAVIEVDGTTYHVSERSDWDPAQQELEVVYVYEPRSGGHSIASSIRHHYLLLDQIAPLLARAGLELTEITNSFDNAPIDATTDHFVAVAKRS